MSVFCSELLLSEITNGHHCKSRVVDVQEILDRTGYSLEITSGQRKYGGPPPNYDGPHPGAGHEVLSPL